MTLRKVLIFLPGGVGGAERVGVLIGKLLPHEQFDVKFIVAQRNKLEITEFIPKYYSVTIIPDRSIRDLCILRMIKMIRGERPDVVFAPCRYLSRNLIIASKLSRISCKIIVRSDNPLKTLDKKGRWLVRKTFPYADVVIAQQEEMAQEIINEYPVPAHKVVVLHNPIDEETISKKSMALSPYSNDDETRFVWVARISETGSKGHDVLIEAMREIRRHINNANLYLVGRYNENGTYYQKLKSLVKDLGLQECVHFIGYDDNPYKWVKNADCFVLPSRVEGLPNALIEAMCLGKPVVSTLCLPIIERIIEDRQNGYKVPIENPSALADAMIKALTLRDCKMTYRPAGREEIIKVFS